METGLPPFVNRISRLEGIIFSDGDAVPKPLGFSALWQTWGGVRGKLELPRLSALEVAVGITITDHPAPIRTSGITAYGSSLRYERRNARRGKDVEFAGEESTVEDRPSCSQPGLRR
jgi:hypothetical protein